MSDSEDDLVAYGTPLEPLEEDEIPNKKPRLLEDQVVTDKQGRRRFHGAFTGGFSAGFFNTVGSLEGWTPSSFKSSKSKKQGAFQQKPEDFMDEEDLSEFGIAPLVLKAKQDYAVRSQKKLPATYKFQALGSYVLHDLLKPVRETVGIKLLKKMGWKPGQGVGPRLNKKEKENILKMREKTYGCQLPPGPQEDKEEYDSDSEWDNVEFAPSDCEPVLFEARNDTSGLGYEGLDKRPVLSGNSLKKRGESITGKNEKSRFSSQAFGVGAFEEEDEDIYARDDMSCYDFALGNDLSVESKSNNKLSLTMEGVLDGFILETKRHFKKHYPLPRLPKDYVPHHKIHRSRFDQVSVTDKVKKDSRIGFEDRRKLFKEQSEGLLEGKIQTQKLISQIQISETEFKPFSSNPDKQNRYENYLRLIKIGKKELLSHIQPLSMTEWDKQREAIEFEKAALLFKPLTGGMGDRFSTAKQPDDLSDPLAEVQKYVDESDDRIKAAKMNMFGPLTRKREDWVPCSLLCKRFNIPEPNKRHVPKIEKKGKYNLFDIVQIPQENREKIKESVKLEIPSPSSAEDNNELKKKEEEKEVQDKGDLFKAIFLASDDEDEDEDEEKDSKDVTGTKEQQPTEQSDLLYEEKLINSKRNLSPPSGIFKNIDLELLSGSKKTTEEPQNARKAESVNNQSVSQVETVEPDSLNLVYGPKIPEKVEVKVKCPSRELLEDGGVWVEKKHHGGKKHKKKDKKNKKSFHKSKHKHKKHKK